MSDFLPKDYELPKTKSMYGKASSLSDGDSMKIRILPNQDWDKCFVYYEYYNEQKKNSKWEMGCPERSVKQFESTPWLDTSKGRVSYCWGLKVWNYETESVQLFTIPQKSIKEIIMQYRDEDDYWDPTGYDLKITRTGEKLETKYGVIASPPKPFDESLLEWNDKSIDWIWFLNSETEIIKDIK